MLESAFTRTAILHHVVEKPIEIIKTETETVFVKEPFDSNPTQTRILNESRLLAVNRAILNQERIDGLKIMNEGLEAENSRLKKEIKRLKKYGGRS
jgi:hypothetical protein